jgi:rhodanese-related sulfurtransferase
MSVRRIQWFLVILIVLFVAACAQGPSTTPEAALERNAAGYTDITVQQLAAMLADKSFTLVNVHVPFEGDIPQTDLSIPYDQIAEHLDRLPDKDVPIVLYCRSGRMSTQAAEALVALGYTHVMELDGGFYAWEAAGYSLAGE